ncbi:unnamed protein product [Coffea canephora]|uniref:Transmembrane protein n=1 Tax=Coffea canephora TaxID=49390 RepID=A0A068U869_COFCA|nr:unnamed protein product [Coffea canephora]
MEISVKLLHYKYHFAAVLISSLIIAIFVIMAPHFLSIFSYFWPLLLSTSILLGTIIVFGQSAPEFYGNGNGEGFLDYVAGRPEELEDF